MDKSFETYFPYIFPFFFAAMWLTVTTILAVISGWCTLVRRYPDRDEEAVLTLRRESGRMGTVGMGGVLRLSACPSGLRVGMMRLFGPFSRDFFVPWGDIRIQRKNRFFWKVAELDLGGMASLQLYDYAANRLWRALPQLWPESGAPPVETLRRSFWEALKFWALLTTLAALFFTVVPRLTFPPGSPYPPLEVAIGFPAFVFGIGAVWYFFRRRSH